MIDPVKPLSKSKIVFLPVCSYSCMQSFDIAVVCRKSAQEECHNDVFLSHWFGETLCLSVPCCQWKYKGQTSWNSNWNTFKCCVVCWMVISPPACCTQPRGARVTVIANKTSHSQCTAASRMESNTREVQSSFYCMCGLPEETCEHGKASTCSAFHVFHANRPGSAGNLCCN